MPVLLAILKILAVLLLILAAILITALLLPLGFSVEYKPGKFRLSAVYGPFRRTLWAYRAKAKKQSAVSETLSTIKKEVPKQPEQQTEPVTEKTKTFCTSIFGTRRTCKSASCSRRTAPGSRRGTGRTAFWYSRPLGTGDRGAGRRPQSYVAVRAGAYAVA